MEEVDQRYKAIGILLFMLIFLGWLVVLFYNTILVEWRYYLVEKNAFIFINAQENIDLLSENPDKSKFIFIFSFYLGCFFLFSYLLTIVFLRDWGRFEVVIPIYKAIPFIIFVYIFFLVFVLRDCFSQGVFLG